MNVRHVYPVRDLATHDTESEGAGCPCGPRVEYLDEGCVVVHNAWDGRGDSFDPEAA